MEKPVIIGLAAIVLIACFSGCIGGGDNNAATRDSNVLGNKPPEAHISASPSEAYFGQEISFDASESVDPDGTITTYLWDFGDFMDSTAKGQRVTHAYQIADDFPPEYPVHCFVTLQVYDNDGSVDMTSYEVLLRPQKFNFFFNKDSSLSRQSRGLGEEKLTARMGQFREPIELTYDFTETVHVPPCTWSANISLRKPLLAPISSVSIIGVSPSGEEIGTLESNAGILSLWRKKTLSFSGSFPGGDIAQLKLKISGFTLRSSLSLIYGGSEASKISFTFT